jgi:GDP-L-fucose synthase
MPPSGMNNIRLCHQGMVGSAIIRELQEIGFDNIVVRTHDELDLTNQDVVNSFF